MTAIAWAATPVLFGFVLVFNVASIAQAPIDGDLLKYGELGALIIVIGLWTWERRADRKLQLEHQERVIERNSEALEALAVKLAVFERGFNG